MRYLLLPLFLLAACTNDLTLPESEPVDTPPPSVVQWFPKYPNAPTCAAGTNGVSEIILHGQTPEQTSSGDLKYFEGAENILRRLDAETYSYSDSQGLCRRFDVSINWTRQNYDGVQHHGQYISASGYQWLSTAPPPANGEANPSGFNAQYGKWYGTDRVIASASPKVQCNAFGCPSFPGGAVADTSFVVVFYE